MEARTLDALVAEKVTGWPGPSTHAYFGRMAGRTLSFADPSVSGRELELPHYSSDIAAAWEVVELLRKETGDFALELVDYGSVWAARFGHFGGALDASAPRAICVAALRARNLIPLN